MFKLRKIFYIGVPSDMDPVEAKYIGMSNIGALVFILFSPLYTIYCLLNGWKFLFYEQLIFMVCLSLTFVFNQKRKHTLALLWFGSVLNDHLVVLSIIFGWEVRVHYLIFFTAGGAIMLFRRRASSLIIPSVIASLVLYYGAYLLSMVIDPLYKLSNRQVAITNFIIEISLFVLIVINAMIGRFGSIASEDQLKAEMAKSNELLQKLKELDRQKTIFFQNISHEFRTPLTLIIGPLETIISEKFGRLGQSLREQLGIIRRNAGRLLGLINQLLDLSRLDEKKMPLRIVRGNITGLVSDTVTSFKPYADKLGINLSMPDEPGTLIMDYDPKMMEKVLINLISNALKFTSSGGWVHVSACEIDEGKNAALIIKDSGKGIPEKELPYIYDRFHQVDGTMTRNQEGTGIGLSLVKEFVELHDGRIEVESVLNKGTKFKIILPKKTARIQYEPQQEENHEIPDESIYYYEKITPEKETRLREKELPRKTMESAARVMIIDDNQDMRGYVRQTIGDFYRIVEASDGEEGLRKARETLPDLIISDVMMPKMDGYELCRQIKNSEELKNTPVILVTARASEEMTLDGIEAGAYDYITKPFSPKILLAKISGILERQELHKRQIQRDSLTGLLNRESWRKMALREIKKNKRYGNVFSIAFIDLDDFKKINDTYSHHTGDVVLKTLSSIITSNLRAIDLAGRFGGEEFVIYFSGTTGKTASDSLERILKLFSTQDIENKNIYCTFSAGVVEMNLLRELSLEEYLSRADETMYAAKKSGKAKIFLYNN
jgi:diguanylate cyclase (GGDEF)-like protein